MTYLGTGVSDPLRLLRDVKQFLFFIEHRLQACRSADDALEILPDVDATLSRLDQAMAQILTDVRRAASEKLTSSARHVPKAPSLRLRKA